MEARKRLGIQRTAMALKLEVSTDRLVTYEYGRVRLPWEVGKRACATFKINPLWLATGKGPRWFYGAIDLTFSGGIEPGASFADGVLTITEKAPEFVRVLTAEDISGDETPKGPFSSDRQQSISWDFADTLKSWLEGLVAEDCTKFVAELTKAGAKLREKYRAETKRSAR